MQRGVPLAGEDYAFFGRMGIWPYGWGFAFMFLFIFFIPGWITKLFKLCRPCSDHVFDTLCNFALLGMITALIGMLILVGAIFQLGEARVRKHPLQDPGAVSVRNGTKIIFIGL